MSSKVKRDIRLDLGMMRHLKMRKLRARTGADGVVSLVTLWLYAGDHHPDGDLSGFGPEDLELAAEWNGEPGAFALALVELRLVDELEGGGGYQVHDWEDHQPYVMGSAARSEKAKKAALAKHGRAPSKPDGCSEHAPSTNRASSEPAPYPSPDPSPSPDPTPGSAEAPSAPAAPAASLDEPVSIVGMARAAHARVVVLEPEVDDVAALEGVSQPRLAAQTQPIDPIVLTIPTSGKDAGEWRVLASFVAEMEDAYPRVDVKEELRKMRAWSVANPKLRKTAAGMGRFINGWLSKCQDRGGSSPPLARAGPARGGGSVAERLVQAAAEAAERERQT